MRGVEGGDKEGHSAYLCSTLSRSKQKILIGGRWQLELKLTLLS